MILFRVWNRSSTLLFPHTLALLDAPTIASRRPPFCAQAQPLSPLLSGAVQSRSMGTVSSCFSLLFCVQKKRERGKEAAKPIRNKAARASLVLLLANALHRRSHTHISAVAVHLAHRRRSAHSRFVVLMVMDRSLQNDYKICRRYS